LENPRRVWVIALEIKLVGDNLRIVVTRLEENQGPYEEVEGLGEVGKSGAKMQT